jgi:hypothetical protein
VVEALFLRDRLEGVVKRGLAVKAAIERIGAIVRLREFVCHDDAMAHTPLRGKMLGQREVAAFEACGTGSHRKRSLTKALGRHVRDQ